MMLIAQLSDSHIVPEGALYQGVCDTAAVMAQAVARTGALSLAPDAILFTGDLAEHGTAQEYARALSLLSPLKAPLLALPGNHDDREGFRAALSGRTPLPATGPLHQVLDIGPLRLIGLDVTVPGEHHGQVDAAAARWLDAALSAEPERPTILAQHQPPYATGLAGIDDYRCFSEGNLAEVLSRHRQVQRLTCGHVHRFTMRAFAGVIACTAPSLSTSLAPHLAAGDSPASTAEPPAMLLHLWRDQAMVSHLLPTAPADGPFDFF